MNKFITAAIVILLAACSQPDTSLEGKKKQLDELKKQLSTIQTQIYTLEKEISTEGGTAETGKVKDVGVLQLTPQVFQHYIEVQGRVEGDENISVSSKMAGVISQIFVHEGEEVKEGQLLAELDNQVLTQGVEELKTQLAFATNLFQKQKSLWDQKIGTEVQFLSAKNNKEALEMKLATLNEQIEMSKIKSPINGMVDAIDIKTGQAFMPGMPGIRVVNFSNLKVKAEIPENYLPKVKMGNDAIIFFPDLNKEIPSKISYSAKVINNITRTFTANATLSTNTQEYHPNMIAVLRIIDYKNDSAIVIPVNLIQRTENTQYVYIAVDENGKTTALKKEVTVGQIYNGNAEIISGLAANDKLITQAYLDVTDGMIVKY